MTQMRRRRDGLETVAAWSLALLVLLILVWGVGGLIREVNARKADIDNSRMLLARYEHAIARLESQAADEPSSVEQPAPSLFLEGETDALAAARLQELLGGLLSSRGGLIASAQALPAEPAEATRRIPVNLQFSGSLNVVSEILREIEYGPLALTIRELGIQPMADGAAAGPGSPVLSVSLVVVGFLPVRERR